MLVLYKDSKRRKMISLGSGAYNVLLCSREVSRVTSSLLTISLKQVEVSRVLGSRVTSSLFTTSLN